MAQKQRKKCTLRKREEQVSIEHDDGTEHSYIIREIDGKARAVYTDYIASRVKFNDEGKPTGVSNPGGAHIMLLKYCLFDDGGKLVPEKVLESWPASTLEYLFEIGAEVCGLTREAEEEVGKG